MGRTSDYVTQRLGKYVQEKGVLTFDLSVKEYREALSGDPLTHYVVFTNHEITKKLKRKGIKATSQRVRLANAHDFHEAISHARENPNGWMVDVHEESDYEDYTCFLTGKCPVPYL